MANISQNVNIEMLEKLPDGTYKRKYPKTRADDGTTFDEHLAGDMHIPTGLISMWSGLISNIPSGWALCDGTNGTPNLINKFIMGSNLDNAGKTGGNNNITLKEENLPAHIHEGGISTGGTHTHGLNMTKSNANSSATHLFASNINTETGTTWVRANVISSGGAHTHNINIQPVGNDIPFDNRPAYFTLAFIMKL